ncbi:MAG: iron-containing alcohol dehydrogenase [Acidobacteriota bacterium]|nr:iron-containing alcohol dehydrogenase [Acidobacteriota bacterium]
MTSSVPAFRLPTRVVLEPGCRRLLPERVAACGAGGARSAADAGSEALLVVDAGLAESPWTDEVRSSLEQQGLRCRIFSGVESNPRAGTVEELAEVARRKRLSPVIAVGGGSVLDAAKAAAMLATNGGHCADYEGAERFQESPLPFIALPTTCGTGSEVTWVSVISQPERRVKISIKGHRMFPDHALVDADFLRTLPAELVAWTALDALTHSLEAITGRLANPASEALATRSVELLLAYLPRAAADIAGDDEAREAVMTASTLAGMAFGNSDVGAVHCLSETLGGGWDVPHGLANALLLVPVLRSHGDSIHAALARVARRALPRSPEAVSDDDSEAASALLAAVKRLVDSLRLPPFADFAIPAEDYDWIATQAAANGSNDSNPRPMTPAEYRAILDGLR